MHKSLKHLHSHIIRLSKFGLSGAEIGRRLECTTSYVSKVRRKYGLPSTYLRLDGPTIAMLKSTFTYDQIAKALNVDRATVIYQRRLLGLPDRKAHPTEEQIQIIINAKTAREAVALSGVKYGTVYDIRRKHVERINRADTHQGDNLPAGRMA